MRILIVGAGATGGYFGAQLTRAGRDVTLLVRPARAALIGEHGLTVHPADADSHDFTAMPKTVTADALADAAADPFDVVLLSVKAYGLEQAITDIAPAVGPMTAVVPVLNGLRHFDVLRERLGADRVVGGLCFIASQLEGDGSIRQLTPIASITYGEFDGSVSKRMLALHAALSGAGFSANLSQHIERDLWQKWVMLAAGGALTTLLRGPVGPIVAAPGGEDVARAIAAECFAVSAAAGHPPSEAARANVLSTLTRPGSDFTTSMYRDLAAGHEVESDQIVGDLVARASALSVPTPLLSLAFTALCAYRNQRQA